MISVPLEFRELCKRFQLASLSHHGSVEGMIDSALSRAGDEKMKVIQKFLSDLLNGKYDSGEIQAVWDSTSANFFIQGDEGPISFLRLIQERIQQICDMSSKR